MCLGTGGLQNRFHLVLEVAKCFFGFLHRDVTATDQLLGVEHAHGALLVDEVIHRRLCE